LCSIYLKIQDGLARKTYATWMADTSAPHASIMTKVRDFNMETSLRVFCGPHIPSSAVREIADKYWQITKALELVNFPLALPGTKVYGAIQARKVAMRWLEDAARKSKIAMQEGRDVECLLDAWAMETMTVNDSNGKNKRDYSDHEMAQVVLSFLFASQDAMSSGIIYMFQHLADHPDILAKIREEQLRVRAGDINIPMSLEMLDEMPYLQACVKESLRTKPPVMMVSRFGVVLTWLALARAHLLTGFGCL
jgi:sterol 22-desaturase